MFTEVLFAIAKIWKHPKCPSVNEWIKRLWYIYIMEYYLAVKKKEEEEDENFTLCNNMDGPGKRYAK